MTFPTEWKHKHVPNHQPDIISPNHPAGACHYQCYWMLLVTSNEPVQQAGDAGLGWSEHGELLQVYPAKSTQLSPDVTHCMRKRTIFTDLGPVF